jgi:hypothetical protein
MKILILLIIAICITGITNAQTYSSNYIIVKTIPLSNLFVFSQKDSDEFKLMDISQVDTINLLNNNALIVIVGTVNIISNDTFSIFDLTIRKSSHPQLLPKGKSIKCLIDHKNNVIYDNAKLEIIPFNVPPVESLILNNKIKKLKVTDTSGIIIFEWNSDLVSISTKKNIPSKIRATILDTQNSMGVFSFKTQSQMMELQNYNLTDKNYEGLINTIKSVCTKKTEIKTLLYL